MRERIAAAMIVIALLLYGWFAYQSWAACDGKLVRGVFWFECVR